MSDYTTIFDLRSQLDVSRQPEFADELIELEHSLPPGRTPYHRVTEVRRSLMAIEHFKVGAKGRRAMPPPSAYLYRLSALWAVRRHTRWKEDTEVRLESALADLVERSSQAEDPEGWFPLAEVAEGQLGADRSFTWWSSQPIRADSVVCDLHKRGLPNDWVVRYSVLLRCRTDGLYRQALSHVPSLLDGFGSVIFHAMTSTHEPSNGTAIDIEEPDQLKLGTDEYALKPVPVDLVEVLPLDIGAASRGHKIYEQDLHGPLEVYYRKEL